MKLPSMNSDLLVAFIGFAFVTSITPGPNNLMVMASGAAFGWRKTMPHIFGIAVGFTTIIGSAVLGIGAVLERIPELLIALRILGSVWLLWLAWQLAAPALRPPSKQGEPTAHQPSRPMRIYEAALFQWVNPKAWTMAIGAAAAYAGLAADPIQRMIIMASVFLIIAPLSNTVWVIAGEAICRFTSQGSSSKFFSLVMAALVAASAALILIG